LETGSHHSFVFFILEVCENDSESEIPSSLITSSSSESTGHQKRPQGAQAYQNFPVSYKTEHHTDRFSLPKSILTLDPEGFSEVISKIFLNLSPEEASKINKLLPEGFAGNPQNRQFLLEKVLKPTSDLFSPAKACLGMLKNGVFSSSFRKTRKIESKIEDYFRLQRAEKALESVKLKKQAMAKCSSQGKEILNAPKLSKMTADSSDESIQDIVLPFERLEEDPGDTTYDSEYEEERNNGVYMGGGMGMSQISSGKKMQEESILLSQKKVGFIEKKMSIKRKERGVSADGNRRVDELHARTNSAWRLGGQF
jgi:hypothetical protein